MFVNKSNLIQLRVPITHYQGTAEENILLDTGATENFIDQTTVNKLRLGTKQLPYARKVFNVDGTLNRSGTITHACDLLVTQGNKKERTRFFVTNLGSCYDPEPLPPIFPLFPPFTLRSRSLVLHSFPHAPLGPSPNHLTSHLIDHMTNPQSTIICHHSAVRSIMTCPHLTLYGLPAHDTPLRSRQLMMKLYLELPRHDEPY